MVGSTKAPKKGKRIQRNVVTGSTNMAALTKSRYPNTRVGKACSRNRANQTAFGRVIASIRSCLWGSWFLLYARAPNHASQPSAQRKASDPAEGLCDTIEGIPQDQGKAPMKHILITNDDGVMAPGLLALVQTLRALEGVTLSVVAPHRNWSASGHVKTLERPLRVWETTLADGTEVLATDGAPSDCVALALLGLLEHPVDLVVSGINPHANLGHDVTYSGTVTAAMEATIFGVMGVAFSLDSQQPPQSAQAFASAAQVARQIVAWVLEHGLPPGVLLNVNIPDRPLEAIRGVQITRQGLRVYRDRLVKRLDPRGKPYYWIGGEAPGGIPEPGTDIGALREGFVSITPLQLDLTAHAHLSDLQALERITL